MATRPSGLRYYSLAEPSGYGMSARAYLVGLAQSQLDTLWSPIVFETLKGYVRWSPDVSRSSGKKAPDLILEKQELYALLDNNIDYDCVLMHTVPEFWPFLHEKNKKNIGYTVWETDLLPPHWPDLYKGQDRLLVPSTFCRDICINSGIEVPIDVVPHICRGRYDLQDSDSESFKTQYGIPDGHWIFYCIGSWTPRKAMWRTLNAYLLAFTNQDPVTFIIKTDPTGVRSEQAKRQEPTEQLVGDIVQNYTDAPNVVLINEPIPDSSIRALHKLGDCFLSLTHTEGWGIGAFDAGAYGNPVIITGWGGQRDYLPAESSYFVDYKLVPVIDKIGTGSYQENQCWAQADLDHAIDCLRTVYSNQDQARRKGQALAEFIADKFNERVVIEKLLKSLNDAYTE